MKFTPTRAAGLEYLDRFIPKVSQYSELRNFDIGNGNHDHVSQLSPYIRCRLINEGECSQLVLRKYRFENCEKFLQEIAWRTYWKGWLEMRPNVWRDFQKFPRETSKNDSYYQAILAAC